MNIPASVSIAIEKTSDICRICNSAGLSGVVRYETGIIDGAYSLVPESASSLLPLELVRCDKCGFLQLRHIISGSIYGDYNFASLNSQEILDFIRKISRYLLTTYSLEGKRVLEIGSGDGSFLEHMSSCETVGIEPSRKLAALSSQKGIRTVNDYLTPSSIEKAEGPFDLVAIRHVLEHVSDINGFVDMAVSVCTQSGLIYLEVPDAERIVKTGNYYNVFFEHLNYFVLSDLVKLMSARGFHLLENGTNTINNGSLYCVFSGNDTSSTGNTISVQPAIGPSDIRTFAEGFTSLCGELRELKKRLRGSKVAGYGAANKTFRILSMGGFDETDITEIYDRNVNLHGKYLSGTGIRVVSPEQIRETNPDTVLLFAGAYQTEIVEYLKQLGYKGRIVTFYPGIREFDL